MKLSTKGRYGLRALIDLAINSEEDHQTLASIAKRQNISEIYMEQVFSTLRKAGIVKSVKGAGGGYFLSYEPDHITVGNILRVLEGDLAIVDLSSDENNRAHPIARCIQQNVWDPVNQHVNHYVDAVTLGDLVLEYQKINSELQPMYYI